MLRNLMLSHSFNKLFIITIILLLVLFHLIIVDFYLNTLGQYTFNYNNYFITSFIPSYYYCFLSSILWVNTLFIITIILLLVLFHLIIVAFYLNTLDQCTFHYNNYFITTFTPSYYCCYPILNSWCQCVLYFSIFRILAIL